MRLVEGELFEGEIGSFGGEGPRQRWLVVAPFGKSIMQSIDEPLDLHYMPLSIAMDSIASGKLTRVAHDQSHPAVQLQREKERRHIRDTHMGRCGDNVERMVVLLRDAHDAGSSYTHFAAGEILWMLRGARFSGSDVTHTESEVWSVLRGGPPLGTGSPLGTAAGA